MNKNVNKIKTSKEIGLKLGKRIKVGLKLQFLFLDSGFLDIIRIIMKVSKKRFK